MFHFDSECSNLAPDVFAALQKIISQTGWVCPDCLSACRMKVDQIQRAQAEIAEKLSDTFVSLAYLQGEVDLLKAHSNNNLLANSPNNQHDDGNACVTTATVESIIFSTLNNLKHR